MRNAGGPDNRILREPYQRHRNRSSETVMEPSLPTPRDIPLPLPIDHFLLDTAVVVLFLAHILFVNVMLGGSTLTLIYEIIGLRKKEYDALARLWASATTVNKSMAVVLGVAPLLVVNVLYTIPFYTANSLTGAAWMMLIPLIAAAFLLGYLHKYTWDQLAHSKALHLALGGGVTLIFWLIPFVFLANINLMLFPERWTETRGFLSTVTMQNVLPRYLHFIIASFAITGLFGAAWFGRAGFDLVQHLPGFERSVVLRRCYELTFGATLMQLLAGTLVYFTLPAQGVTFFMTAIVLAGVACAVLALTLLWKEVVAPAAHIGRHFLPIVLVLSITVACMAMGRHVYREESLAGHRARMATNSETFQLAVQDAQWRKDHGIILEPRPAGERLFQVCAGCHSLDQEKAGPAVREIQELYADNLAGIVKWAKAPGRKRTKFSPMPPFGHLSDGDLQAVARYMLQLGQTPEPAEDAAESAPAPEAAEGTDAAPTEPTETAPPESASN